MAVELLPADVEPLTHLDGYVQGQCGERLLTTVTDLLYDEPPVSSAGLLKGGAACRTESAVLRHSPSRKPETR